MAQWQELLRLNLIQGHLSHLYETRFPRHIRHCLCFCIESQDWDLAAVDKSKASACLHAILAYLQEQWNCSSQEINSLAPDFPGMMDYFMKHFKDDPQNLAIILSECLKEEKKVLASASEKQDCFSPAVDEKQSKLDNLGTELKRLMMDAKREMKSMEILYENFDYIQKTWLGKVQQHAGFPQSPGLNEECLKHANLFIQTKQVVMQEMVKILKQAEQIVTILIDVELPEWKCRQQMACIGCPADASLDHLQKWFTTVTKVLLQVRQQLPKMRDQNKKYNIGACSPLEEMDAFAQSLLTKLLTNALVVEKQPVMSNLPQRPLIVKTNVRFTATVRFLSNLPEFKDLLKVTPVFDKDVEEATTVKGFRLFDFCRDNSKVLDVDSPSGGLVAEFAHMSLKESKRRTKGSCENHVGVTEELHVIKFVTVLHHAGLECVIEVSSLPLIVISSTSQAPSAWASVMWCNMLSTSEPRNLSLFSDPPPVSWSQLSQVLNWQFLSAGKRELDENQLSMLRDKIGDGPGDLVSWSNFSKNDSGWIWIDGILDLITKHLVDLWHEGYIMGFVSRERTQMLLQEKPTGTFLLRFSESNKDGAITFSWVNHSNGETHVYAVEPYSKKELQYMSLPDRLYRYGVGSKLRNPLIYLYPDIPKDSAFGRYYKTSALLRKDQSGYLKRLLFHVSLISSPPHSPPMDVCMDADANPDADPDMELIELLEEFFSDILSLPGIWNLESTQDNVIDLDGI